MGVSGSGKTTIGEAIASRTGWPFMDADLLHPQANIDKMEAGIPLTDADRRPWLDLVADWIGDQHKAGQPGVIACSALRRSYRDLLREADPDLRIVYLHADREALAERLRHREGHFFPRPAARQSAAHPGGAGSGRAADPSRHWTVGRGCGRWGAGRPRVPWSACLNAG